MKIHTTEKKKQIQDKILNALANMCFSIAGMILVLNFFNISIVSGESMDPTLKDGDILICANFLEPKDQDIITINTQNNNLYDGDAIVKRYYENKSTDTGIWVEGDNAEVSWDSRFTGLLDREDVQSVVLVDISELMRNIFN